MTARASLIACVAVAVVCASSAPAAADDAGPAVFIGTTRGGDAQLHPALPQVTCLDCPGFPAASSLEPEPNLATVGVSLTGTEGHFRGGVELFTIVAATGGASGYGGLVTYAGLELGRAYAVGGFGFGSYYGGHHPDRYTALAGVVRGELGLVLPYGFSVAVRTDVLENDISRSFTASLGIGWAAD